VVVPGTLVLRVGVESILEHLQVAFDSVNRNGIQAADLINIHLGEEFPSVVPS